MAANSDNQLRNLSLADKARDRLRAAIFEGELKPGDKINIERAAENFGISRTPIREALKALETEGLVQIQANRGAIVEPQVWQEIHHRYHMRSLLEGYAAELSCALGDATLIADLRENCAQSLKASQARTVTADRARAIAQFNRNFHRRIWLGSGSMTLVRFLEALDLPQSFNDAFYKAPATRQAIYEQHEKILAAFVAGDVNAAGALMREHVRSSVDLLASQAVDHIGDPCC